MRTNQKDKMVIKHMLEHLLDVVSCEWDIDEDRLGGRLKDRQQYEEFIRLLAVYTHVKPETMKGWHSLSFDEKPVICMYKQEKSYE